MVSDDVVVLEVGVEHNAEASRRDYMDHVEDVNRLCQRKDDMRASCWSFRWVSGASYLDDGVKWTWIDDEFFGFSSALWESVEVSVLVVSDDLGIVIVGSSQVRARRCLLPFVPSLARVVEIDRVTANVYENAERGFDAIWGALMGLETCVAQCPHPVDRWKHRVVF